MKIKHVSSKKRSLSLPKAFPKSPQRVPQRLPKTPQRFPKSASFFLLLSDSCFHPFCKQHQLYSRYSHRASDCLAYLAVSLLSFGVFRIGFFLKKQPKLRAVPSWWNRKKRCFFLFFFAISLHIFALKTSSVLQNCPCIRRYLFVFFRLLLRCGVFGITFFATKNSPNQPKLCEVPRWGNHKKHVLFSYFCLLGPPISLHMFCLKTSSGLQNCPFGRQYVFFFVRCRFTCLAYLGGLSFDFCECFTLFNDEALNFLTFYTQTAKAVCDACTLLPCSPIYLQGGLGGTNEPQVCDATPKRFFICVL